MEIYWPAVLASSTTVWAVMMYRTTRKWRTSIDETFAARERARIAESEVRILRQKFNAEAECAAIYRSSVREWADRYHKLWAETHLGSDVIRGDDDDGRS